MEKQKSKLKFIALMAFAISIAGCAGQNQQTLLQTQEQVAINEQTLHAVVKGFDDAALQENLLGSHLVYFDPDSSSLRAGSVVALEKIAQSLKSSPAVQYLQVVGHSDDNGDPGYNEKLAQARARNVAAILMAQGISADQVQVKSFGSSRPVTSNSTPEGRQLNRRVELFVSTEKS